MLSCGEKPGEKHHRGIDDFKVFQLQLSSVNQSSRLSDFPRFEKEYVMYGTILDVQTQTPMIKQKFVMDMGEEGEIVLETDELGQITWKEKVVYHMNSDKHKIKVERYLRAKDNKSKKAKITFYLYPYASNLNEETSEFFLKIPQSEKSVTKFEALKAKGTKIPLEMKNLLIKANYVGPTQKGMSFLFELESNVIAEVLKLNSEIVDFTLMEGSFDLFIELIDDETREILFSEYFLEVLLKNNRLIKKFNTTLPVSSKFRKLRLNIRLSGKGENELFKSFHGSTELGTFLDLNNEKELTFNHKENSRFSDFKIGFEKKTKAFSINTPLRFSKLDLNYDYIEDGETPTVKTIIYRSKTCVMDSYEDREISFENFIVEKASGEKISLTSDSDGCLYWNERIQFKYYKPERFVKRTNLITHKRTNVKKQLNSYINPWTILTIGRDEREMDKETLEKLAKREDVHSKLFLEQYSFETTGVTYHMDEFMTLFVRKKIRLDLEFGVTRYSSLTEGINAQEEIRDGVYLLKVALEKNYIDTRKSHIDIKQSANETIVKNSLTRRPLEYIYVVNKLVRVWQGHIITPIELSIHDLRLMTVRSNFLVQIQTIDQNLLGLSKNFDIEEIENDTVALKVDRIINQKAREKLREMYPGQKVDLNLLVDEDSGLATRTFMGPMILLEMEGGADVIPTDALAQCFTDDCNYLERHNMNLKSRKYRHDRKYYGGIEHLIDKSVDDLLKQKIVLDYKYHNQKRVESLIFNYLQKFNLEYVSDDEKAVYSLPTGIDNFTCPDKDINQCLVPNSNRNISRGEFHNLIKGENVSEFYDFDSFSEYEARELSKNICLNLLGKLSFKSSKFRFGRTYSVIRENEMWHKINALCKKEQQFSFNKIIQTGGVDNFDFLGGKTINFDLGSTYAIEYSESLGTDFEASSSFSFSELVGKLFKVLDGVTDIIGFDVGLSGAASTEFGYGDSSEISSTTYLAMQRATFDMKFLDPKVCIEIRPMGPFLENLAILSNRYKEIKADLQVFLKGYLYCNEKKDDESLDKIFRENFYYFAQHFTEGHMLDDGSILNHPWLLGVRGERDYNRFVKQLGLKPSAEKREIGPVTKFFNATTQWYLDDSKAMAASFTKNNLAELPLDQISEAYDNILPTFPGIYVVGKQKKEFPYD